MTQVFVSKSGSSIGCHMAQIFIDIHRFELFIEKSVQLQLATSFRVRLTKALVSLGFFYQNRHYGVITPAEKLLTPLESNRAVPSG